MNRQTESYATARIQLSTMAIAIFTLLGIELSGASVARAQLQYDQNVTPDVIFGSGNANGSFATNRRNGIELGLRATIPFVGTINSNGSGAYSFTLAETATCPTPNCWNFDWTVNTDFPGSTGKKLDDYTYEIGMDAHAGFTRNSLAFDPITPSVATPCFDHAIGDNATANGAGVEVDCGLAGAPATYSALLTANNAAQNSWRYAFFSTFPPMDTYDPNVSGIYDVYLLAKNLSDGKVAARVDIRVLIETPPQSEWLTCVGFDPPMNQAYLPPALGGGEIGRKVKKNKVLPFKAVLLDSDGIPVLEFADPPEIVVLKVTIPPEGVVLVDVTADALTPGKKTEGTKFVLSGDSWSYNLATKNMADVSQYYVIMESGDMSQYVIAPSCIGLFVIEE